MRLYTNYTLKLHRHTKKLVTDILILLMVFGVCLCVSFLLLIFFVCLTFYILYTVILICISIYAFGLLACVI